MILNLWVYIARPGKVLEGTGRAWGAVAGEPALLQGSNLGLRGVSRCDFPLVFQLSQQALYLAAFFSVEGRTVALVFLSLLFPPAGGKDMFSNEQVYIFVSPKHSFVDERVVKHLKAIFFDMSFSV